MTEIITKEKDTNWVKQVLQGIREDFKLRKMLMPIRRSDLSSKVKKEDKLGIKPAIFFSTFLLFNASIGTLYLTFQAKTKGKYFQIPVIFFCFALLGYKLEVEWVSRDIIRKCESSSSDIAYFVRKQLLEQYGQHPFVKSRVKLLQCGNKRYEQLYKA